MHTFVVYRGLRPGQCRRLRRETGTFYTFDPGRAEAFAANGKVVQKTVRVERPLFVTVTNTGGHENAAKLLGVGVLPPLPKKFRHGDPESHEAFRRRDKIIAEAARQAGYDAIVFRGRDYNYSERQKRVLNWAMKYNSWGIFGWDCFYGLLLGRVLDVLNRRAPQHWYYEDLVVL